MNNVNLVGRITKDLELKYTASGMATLRFTVAVNRTSKKEGQPTADFINCVAFSKQAENLANYQGKGSLVGVEGRIQTGSYEGQDGKKVYTTDVIANMVHFLGNKQEQGTTVVNNNYQPPQDNVFTQPQNNFQQGPGNQQPFQQQPQQQYQQQTFTGQPEYAPQNNQQQFTEDQLPF